MTKLVRFNVVTEVHNIPDSKYQQAVEEMEKLEEEDSEKHAKRLTSSRNKYIYISVTIGQELEVPNWYYEAHKDDQCHIGVSFDKYKAKDGRVIPFNTAEAVRHGDMVDGTKTIKSVKRFDLIRDMDAKEDLAIRKGTR